MTFIPTFEHRGTYEDSEYPHLWTGRVGAWCPCVNPAGGLTLYDHSIYRSHGTIQSSAMTWDRENGQYSLDNYVGTATGTSMVLCGDGPQFNFASNSLSLVGWARYMGTAATRFFASQHATGILVRIGASATTGLVRVEITGSGGSRTLIGTTDARSGLWLHYAFSSSVSGTFLYINGLLEASDTELTGTCNFANNGGEMTLGAYANPAISNAWPGRFDDIAIYSRAISSNEAKELAMIGRGGAYVPRSRMFYPIISEESAAFKPFWASQANKVIQYGVAS